MSAKAATIHNIIDPNYPDSESSAELARRIAAIMDEYEGHYLSMLGILDTSSEALAVELAETIGPHYNHAGLQLNIVNELLEHFEETRAAYVAAILKLITEG